MARSVDSNQELGSQASCHCSDTVTADCVAYMTRHLTTGEWSLWQLSTLPNQSRGWNLRSTIQWTVEHLAEHRDLSVGTGSSV